MICTKVCSKFLKVSVCMPDLGGMSSSNVLECCCGQRIRTILSIWDFSKLYVSYIGSNNSYGGPRSATLGALGTRVGVNVFFCFLILARRFL